MKILMAITRHDPPDTPPRATQYAGESHLLFSAQHAPESHTFANMQYASNAAAIAVMSEQRHSPEAGSWKPEAENRESGLGIRGSRLGARESRTIS